MHESVTIIERMSVAVRSNDLRHRRGPCHIDVIGARGLGAGRQDVGGALLDLHCSLHASDIPAARRAAFAVTKRCAERNGWSMMHQKLRRIADESLRLYLNPACSCCQGRGMVGLDRDKSGHAERVRPCPACSGSGRQPVPIKYGREIREVVYRMDEARHQAGAQVRRALGVRAELE